MVIRKVNGINKLLIIGLTITTTKILQKCSFKRLAKDTLGEHKHMTSTFTGRRWVSKIEMFLDNCHCMQIGALLTCFTVGYIYMLTRNIYIIFVIYHEAILILHNKPTLSTRNLSSTTVHMTKYLYYDHHVMERLHS